MSTFGELKENVSYELGLDETGSGDDDTILGRRLNEAVRKVLEATHCYVITASISLAANDNEYELPAVLTPDPLAITSIINSDNVTLERVSVEEIHDRRRGTPATGSGIYKYAVNGANLLMIYPTPSASGSLTVYFVPTPAAAMTAAGHDPSDTGFGGVPVQFHDLIELWACYRMASADDDQSSGMGQTYKQLFDLGVREARAKQRRIGGRKLGPVRRGRRLYVPRDPSQT